MCLFFVLVFVLFFFLWREGRGNGMEWSEGPKDRQKPGWDQKTRFGPRNNKVTHRENSGDFVKPGARTGLLVPPACL